MEMCQKQNSVYLPNVNGIVNNKNDYNIAYQSGQNLEADARYPEL